MISVVPLGKALNDKLLNKVTRCLPAKALNDKLLNKVTRCLPAMATPFKQKAAYEPIQQYIEEEESSLTYRIQGCQTKFSKKGQRDC